MRPSPSVNILSALAAVAGRQPKSGPRIRFEHQVFALACAVMAAACLVYAPLYWFVLDERVGAIAILLSVVPLGPTIYIYQRTGSYRLGLHLIAVAANLVITFLVIWQGGVSAPLAPWLMLMPIALVTGADLMGGVLWFTFALVELVVLALLQAAGVQMPFHRGSDPHLLFMLSQPGLVTVVFLFLWVVGRNREHDDRVLAERTADLAKARDQAEAASRAKSQFFANMSHEIRTPMNGVLGATEYLATTTLTDDQRHFVQVMKRSGENLLTLLNDVLDFSKIEAGKLELESVAFSPREKAESICELLAARAAEKGLDLVCRVATDVPEKVLGDPARVRQILTNLLNNAIKFTAQGEVALEIERAPSTEGVKLRFTVRDTGIGIDPEVQANLFQPFTQADGSTTRLYGGTGLGLAICADLTKLMGGELSLDSRAGAGSTFYCTLPFRGVDASLPPPPLPEGLRVALVQPQLRTRAILEEMLGAMGARVDAVDSLESLPRDGKVDAVLIDDEAMSTPAQQALVQAWAKQTRLVRVAAVDRHLPDTMASLFAATLRKPVRRAQLREALVAAPAASNSAAASAGGLDMRILLAEDNVVNQQIALALLKRLGCTVEIVADGAAAVDAWRNGKFDIILMDCQMPVMDGYDATRTIRKLEREGSHARTPIVAVTANAMAGDREQCLACGMDEHLAKPYNSAHLQATLARVARLPTLATPGAGLAA